MTKKIQKKELNKSENIMGKDIFIDIFDVEYTQDLPQEVIKILNPIRKLTLRGMITEFFLIKDTLTYKEIICGLYRKHNLIKSKNNIQHVIQHLLENKQIVRKSAECYQKVKVMK